MQTFLRDAKAGEFVFLAAPGGGVVGEAEPAEEDGEAGGRSTRRLHMILSHRIFSLSCLWCASSPFSFLFFFLFLSFSGSRGVGDQGAPLLLQDAA